MLHIIFVAGKRSVRLPPTKRDDLVKGAGFRLTQAASDRGNWKSKREAYVQRRTICSWYYDDDNDNGGLCFK